jgi:hypothetical protein
MSTDEPGRKGSDNRGWLSELDSLLRGDLTRISALKHGGLLIDPARISVIIVVLAMIYGVCMGTFAVFRPKGADPMQVLASMVKVPLLFYLTLLVTFPSLYVFNALVGSRLRLLAVVRLLVGSLGVTVTVLASLGPIVAFFSVSTASYPFMLLFNVLVYTIAGGLGMAFLLQTLHRLSVIDSQPAEPVSAELDEPSGALDPLENRVLSKHVKVVFRLCQGGFPSLGRSLCIGRRPDGLGAAPVRGQPQFAFHLVPRPRVEFLPGCLAHVPESLLLNRGLASAR